MAEPTVSEHLAALDRFVTDNDDLLTLEERIGRFNIFDALGVARREINHSNFLAWLLDPSESHGQGDLFLKAVVMDMFKHAPTDKRPLSAAHLDGADLHDAEVRREWKNIDLLVVSRAPSLEFVIAVENKVDSGEHSDQLSRYERTVHEEFDGLRTMFVFLTPSGEEASDDDWVAYSYADLHDVLSRVRRTAGGSLGPDVAAFLDHYLTLVKRQLMTDNEIDDLCRRIYKNHKAAIDLIVERNGSAGNPIISELTRQVRTQPNVWAVTKALLNEVRFVPQAWVKALPPIRRTHSSELASKHGWVACYFWCKDGYLEFSVWVLKTTEPAVQERVLKRLTKDPAEFGFQLPKRRTRWTEGWTPILEKKIAEWDAESDPDVTATCKRAMETLDEFTRCLTPVAQAIQSACASE